MNKNVFQYFCFVLTCACVTFLMSCSSEIMGDNTTTNPTTNLTVASPFQDRMVLQRNKPINVWGQAAPGSQITATLNGATAVAKTNDSGTWRMQLPTQTAGGPYQLSINSRTSNRDSQTIHYKDVLIGDVWFLYGQSNMVWPLSRVDDAKDVIQSLKNNDKVRYLHVDRQVSLTPLTATKMTWQDNSKAHTWSAVASFFAHELNAATDVPVGIIVSAFGSSSIEGWMPSSLANELPHFASRLSHYQSIDEAYKNIKVSKSHDFKSNEAAIAQWSQIDANEITTPQSIFLRTRPNVLFNRMVAPLIPYSISGFVWYQGEANSKNQVDIDRYPASLSALITTYRQRFEQGDLPYFLIQLPSIKRNKLPLWPEFRLAQASVTELNNTHVAVAIDTGSTKGNIHPRQKKPIGERIALLARKYSLGENIEAQGPTMQSIEYHNNKVIVTFDTASALRTTDGKPPAMFELAGRQHTFKPANATIINHKQIELKANGVTHPIKVRYAHHMLTKGIVNLTNVSGLPAAPFNQ